MTDRRGVMSKKNKFIAVSLFIIYILVLTWIIIFKTMPYLTYMPARSLNLIPFKGTAVYNGRYDYRELVGNIIIFIPFGVFISMAVRKFNLVAAFVYGAVLSFVYETIQYILVCGAADITDVIMNTAGALIGAIVYLIFKVIFKNKHIEVINAIGIVMLLMLIAFFVMQR